MIFTPFKISNRKTQYVTAIFVVMLILIVGKDLMHSHIRNYSFYLSESLLFGTFWLIFIPFVFFFKKISSKKSILVLPIIVSLLHLLIFSLLVFVISELFFNYTFDIYRTFLNTTSQYGIVCLIVYSISCFLFLNKEATYKQAKREESLRRIKVLYNTKTVILNCDDILYVKSEKPYIALVTKDKTYLHNSSLKKFLKESSDKFIQIHKSIILNTDVIVSYTSRKNGDYDIQLKNEDVVRASRSYNANFKPFFDSISLK